MLRLQWTQTDNQPTWVASVQSVQSGELRWFPSLDALVQFLQEEFGCPEQAQNMQSATLPGKDELK